jgi:hypothetical protein
MVRYAACDPILIFLADYWDIIWMSSAQKTELILQEINNLDLWGKFSQGKVYRPWFSSGIQNSTFQWLLGGTGFYFSQMDKRSINFDP